MLTFLFWNLNRKPLQASVARLAVAHDVDVMILAEGEVAAPEVVRSLNRLSPKPFYPTFSKFERIRIYVRFPQEFVTTLNDTPEATIRLLRLPARPEILLVAVHLPSQSYMSREGVSTQCTLLSQSVSEVEERVGHSRTILTGDLNLNPFDRGVVETAGLHGVMTRDIAERETRTVRGRTHRFFFNPMWSKLGDGSPGPAGTYYFGRSEPVSYFWNMFDQVLVRPELLRYFSSDDVRILVDDGTEPLVTGRGTPNKTTASDHLPVLFRLNL
jgi:hypothetical protein